VVAQIQEASRLSRQAAAEANALIGSHLGAKFSGLAKKFPVYPLGELTSHIVDGPHQTPRYLPEGLSGIPFITVKNMVTGTLNFTDLNYISEEDHRIFSKRCKAEKGDVLYSKDGATRGRPCLVATDREFSYFVSVALIKPLRDRLDGGYLVHLLNSHWITDRMIDKSRGDMIPHIVLREIQAYPVPLPPPHEQRRIIAELDAWRADLSRLQRSQAEASAELEALLPGVLDRAFEGHLG
jgi:type I restriction enzyme S subunit